MYIVFYWLHPQYNTCHYIAECRKLDFIENAQFLEPYDQHDTQFGAVLKFVCNDGYRLQKNHRNDKKLAPEIECLGDQTWKWYGHCTAIGKLLSSFGNYTIRRVI